MISSIKSVFPCVGARCTPDLPSFSVFAHIRLESLRIMLKFVELVAILLTFELICFGMISCQESFRGCAEEFIQYIIAYIQPSR